MNMVLILLGFIFLLSAFLGFLILPRIVDISKEKNLFDDPDERKVHKKPISRLGGISFMPIAFICLFLFNCMCVWFMGEEVSPKATNTFMHLQTFGIGLMLLYIVGIGDDLVGVNFKAKFAAQIAAAALLCAGGLTFHSGAILVGLSSNAIWFTVPVTIFMVVYITNALNLIDGVDGLASGIGILTLSLYTVLFLFLHSYVMACACISILGVLCMFFLFNVFGGEKRTLKKLFMGDTGSLTLGYSISFFILILEGNANSRAFVVTGAMYAAFAPLVIPLLDIIRVVCARYRDRVPLFLPDKRHIHHKLLRTGLTPKRTMATILLLTIWFIALNIVLPQYFSARWVVVGNAISWIIMHYSINYFIRRKAKKDDSLEKKYANNKNTIQAEKSYDL